MDYKPNAQQQIAIDALRDPSIKKVIVKAGPGTGKTKGVIRHAFNGGGTEYKYFAFNKAIVAEAKEILTGNAVSTFHGYFRGLSGGKYESRLNAKSGMSSDQMARHLGINSEIELPESGKFVSRTAQARIITRAIRKYALSDSRDIGPWHIQGVRGYTPEDMKILRSEVSTYLPAAWDDIKSYQGKLNFQLNYLIKMFSWRKMGKNTQRAVVDEGQDLFKVLESWLYFQTVPWALIGDPCQEINGWTGANDAMNSKVTEGATVLSLDQTYRFNQEIADLANILQPFSGKDVNPIIGNPDLNAEIGRTIDNPTAILCRTNSDVLSSAIQQLEMGRAVSMPENQVEELNTLANVAGQLMAGMTPTYAEFAAFTSWADFKSWVKDDPEGEDYAVSVKLIDEHQPQGILDLLSKVNSGQTDVMVTTAHRTKGQEFDRVQLKGFKSPAEDKDVDLEDAITPEFAMLLYTAITRSKFAIGLGEASDWLTDVDVSNSIENISAEMLESI